MFKMFRPKGKPERFCLFCDAPAGVDIKIGNFKVLTCGEHIDLALDTYNAARKEKRSDL